MAQLVKRLRFLVEKSLVQDGLVPTEFFDCLKTVHKNAHIEIKLLGSDSEAAWVHAVYQARLENVSTSLLLPRLLAHHVNCNVLSEAVHELTPHMSSICVNVNAAELLYGGTARLHQACTGVIAGFGVHSIAMALDAVRTMTDRNEENSPISHADPHEGRKVPSSHPDLQSSKLVLNQSTSAESSSTTAISSQGVSLYTDMQVGTEYSAANAETVLERLRTNASTQHVHDIMTSNISNTPHTAPSKPMNVDGYDYIEDQFFSNLLSIEQRNSLQNEQQYSNQPLNPIEQQYFKDIS